MKIHLLFIGLLGLLAVSCCKPAAPSIYLQIRDAAGNDLLENETASDNNWALLHSSTDPIGEPIDIISIENGWALDLSAWDIASEQDFFLRVDSTDVDTVNLVFDVKGRCSLKPKVDRATYNGNDFQGTKENSIVLTKY